MHRDYAYMCVSTQKFKLPLTPTAAKQGWGGCTPENVYTVVHCIMDLIEVSSVVILLLGQFTGQR